MMFIPQPWGTFVGGVLYFAVLVLVFGLGKWSTQLKYSPYPHYEFKTRPKDEDFNIFADRDSVMQKSNGGETGTIIFHTPFKTDIPGFEGKKEKVALYYKGKFDDRVSLRSRSICINGFVFDHPQSDFLVVRPRGSYLDHGVEVPAFELINGALDGEYTFVDVNLPSPMQNGETRVFTCGKCGAPLPSTSQELIDCPYCGAKNKVKANV
jgi:DNA-directed RNA polymerase subunit RPC12/RpoP